MAGASSSTCTDQDALTNQERVFACLFNGQNPRELGQALAQNIDSALFEAGEPEPVAVEVLDTFLRYIDQIAYSAELEATKVASNVPEMDFYPQLERTTAKLLEFLDGVFEYGITAETKLKVYQYLGIRSYIRNAFHEAANDMEFATLGRSKSELMDLCEQAEFEPIPQAFDAESLFYANEYCRAAVLDELAAATKTDRRGIRLRLEITKLIQNFFEAEYQLSNAFVDGKLRVNERTSGLDFNENDQFDQQEFAELIAQYLTSAALINSFSSAQYKFLRGLDLSELQKLICNS